MFGFALSFPWLQKPPPAEQATKPPAFESLVPAPVFEPGPEVVFKWQDPSGTWHYGDTSPEEQIPTVLSLSSPDPVYVAPPGPLTENTQPLPRPGS